MGAATDPNVSPWEVTRRDVLRRDSYRCLSCKLELAPQDADVHHLLPRSMGGTDELANLVTLCEGCHAAHHPNLAGGLARRAIEHWGVRLARWLDRTGTIVETTGHFGPALRLFGVQRFRNGPLPIVLAALAGKSILVVSPTGFGKTLCFQLPALLRGGVALVVSPLKTLMSEQVSDLLTKKIPATYINSDLSPDEKEMRLSMLTGQAFKLLYVAPERFYVRNEMERARLLQIRPSFFVVDEAHCVDQWGKDFRPEYGRLRDVRDNLSAPPVLAFTATAGQEMQQRILASLGIPDAKVFVRDVDRPNIATLRWECPPVRRAQVIAELLALPEMTGQRAMIFVPSVSVGEALQESLRDAELDVPFYHSRLGTPWERQELVKRFLGQSLPVVSRIICTNAFGMGLDVPNVRLVVHWQQSASVEDMLQEFGRAGRDGKHSLSVIFHDAEAGKDASKLKFMAEKTVEASPLGRDDRLRALDHRKRQIDHVSNLLRSPRCFRQSVREYFGAPGTSNRRVALRSDFRFRFAKGSLPSLLRPLRC